jgi:hypothetical protein
MHLGLEMYLKLLDRLKELCQKLVIELFECDSWLVFVAFEKEAHEETESLAFFGQVSVGLLRLGLVSQNLQVCLKPSLTGGDQKLQIICRQVPEPLGECFFVVFCSLYILQNPHRHKFVVFVSKEFVP